MKVIHCDICGKEIKSDSLIVDVWDKRLFIDTDQKPIEDVCEDCFKMIFCCVNMMKRTGWRPDFHEKLNSESIWESDTAAYTLEKLEEMTKLKLL